MGNRLEEFGMQQAQNAAGGVMGMIMGGWNDSRQRDQQQKLQDMQIAGQKEMAEFNRKQQMRMWEDTNYFAQVEQLKKAGLNPGLIYGMSGGGGATTGGGGGAGPTGAQAPAGGGEMQAMMGMGIQSQLLEAQRKNIEANTEKTKVETTKAAGVDTTKAISETGLLDMQKKLQEYDLKLKNATFREQEDIIIAAASKLKEEVGIAEQEHLLSREQRIMKTEVLRQELANLAIKNLVDQKSIEVSDAQIKKWSVEIAQTWAEQDLRKKEITLKAIEADIKTNFPGLWNVIGGWLYGSSKKLGEIFGDDKIPTAQEKVK